jgi:hypothetical protein
MSVPNPVTKISAIFQDKILGINNDVYSYHQTFYTGASLIYQTTKNTNVNVILPPTLDLTLNK